MTYSRRCAYATKRDSSVRKKLTAVLTEVMSDPCVELYHNKIPPSLSRGSERLACGGIRLLALAFIPTLPYGRARDFPPGKLNRLVKRLQDNKYLILMDSVENIMEGNEEKGWNNFRDDWWEKFFESLLAVESCQSRIILTSQDLLHQIPQRYRNFWHCILLSGLAESEQLELFEKTGLEVDTDLSTRQYLQRIGAAYEGHPLALRVISGEIGAKPFNGNVVAYWKKYGHEIEEVEKAIAEAKTQGIMEGADDQWKLDRYTRQLRQNVQERLEKTFRRLKRDMLNAYRLLCEGSIYRCGVPEKFWLNHLADWECDEDEQELALEVLRDRYLLEEVLENDDLLVRQHNLIRSVALEHHKNLEDEDE